MKTSLSLRKVPLLRWNAAPTLVQLAYTMNCSSPFLFLARLLYLAPRALVQKHLAVQVINIPTLRWKEKAWEGSQRPSQEISRTENRPSKKERKWKRRRGRRWKLQRGWRWNLQRGSRGGRWGGRTGRRPRSLGRCLGSSVICNANWVIWLLLNFYFMSNVARRILWWISLNLAAAMFFTYGVWEVWRAHGP